MKRHSLTLFLFRLSTCLLLFVILFMLVLFLLLVLILLTRPPLVWTCDFGEKPKRVYVVDAWNYTSGGSGQSWRIEYAQEPHIMSFKTFMSAPRNDVLRQ